MIFQFHYIWVNCSESLESYELKTQVNISNQKIDCDVMLLKSRKKFYHPYAFSTEMCEMHTPKYEIK